MEDFRPLSKENSTMNRSFQPPDRAMPEMEQISIPLRSMDICSISESVFLSFFGFWVENVSRDIDNISHCLRRRAVAFLLFLYFLFPDILQLSLKTPLQFYFELL